MFSADISWSPMVDEVSVDRRRVPQEAVSKKKNERRPVTRDRETAANPDSNSLRSSRSGRSKLFGWARQKASNIGSSSSRVTHVATSSRNIEQAHIPQLENIVELPEDSVAVFELPSHPAALKRKPVSSSFHTLRGSADGPLPSPDLAIAPLGFSRDFSTKFEPTGTATDAKLYPVASVKPGATEYSVARSAASYSSNGRC
jgi:hypothetical protein